MLFDTHSTQAAQASLDALWMQTKVIANNMANVDTPNFKASHVSFDEVLDGVRAGRAAERDENSSTRAGVSRFRTTIRQDDVSSVRIDGNNVSLEREQTDLWKTYAQYSYLLDSVAGHYRNIGTAISTMKR